MNIWRFLVFCHHLVPKASLACPQETIYDFSSSINYNGSLLICKSHYVQSKGRKYYYMTYYSDLSPDGHGPKWYLSHEIRSNAHLAQVLNTLQIYLITFVSNTTHFSQPLDVSFFGPMKRRWVTYARNWIDNHPDSPITNANFNKIFIPFVLNHFKHVSPHVGAGF